MATKSKPKHYWVDKEKKLIIVGNIKLLTPEEEAEIEKFKRFGYEMVEGEKPKGTKRLNDDFIRNKWSDEGNKGNLEKYNRLCEEEKIDKNGKLREKGFNAGRNFFAKTEPIDVTLTDKEEQDIKEAFVKYTKAKANEKKRADKKGEQVEPALTKEEYKRYYYWTKIFKR